MSKRAELKDAMIAAMKAKDEVTLATVRLINAKVKDKDIEARSADTRDGIADDQILAVLQGMVKQRQESAEIYGKNGRPELAERENAEIAVIQKFLPQRRWMKRRCGPRSMRLSARPALGASRTWAG